VRPAEYGKLTPTDTNMARVKSKQPPLPRREKLRRTVILCCHCARNIAYYRAGWTIDLATKEKRPLCTSQFYVTVNGNFIDTAVLEWCKLFGDHSNEGHHWRKILEQEEKKKQFGEGLYKFLGCARKGWNELRDKAIAYRNEFLARLGEEPVGELPFLSYAVRSAIYYHGYLLKHENDGHTYQGLPLDPEAYYQECEAQGNRHYEALRR
jgi:hypothetical protein